MNAYDVGLGCNLKRAATIFNAEDHCLLGRQTSAPRDYRHTERTRTRDHLMAYLPDADQPKRATVESAGLRKLLLVPLSRTKLDHVVRNAPIQSEDERERKLGDCYRILAGAVRYVD